MIEARNELLPASIEQVIGSAQAGFPDFLTRDSEMPHLTPLMHKILELVYREHTDEEIAEKLGRKTKTVSNYLYAIYQELQVKGRVGAALWFSQNHGDQAYKYPDTYAVELRRLGYDKKYHGTDISPQSLQLDNFWEAVCSVFLKPCSFCRPF